MTIEEKAKAYDEVLERVKPLYEWAKKDDSPMWSTYEYLFPELREKEDERIGNLIYCIVRDREDVRVTLEANGVSVDNALAYLEKQKEQKPVEIHIDNPNVQKFDPSIEITTSDSSADGKELLYVSNKSYKIGFRDGVNSVKQEWSEKDEKIRNAILGFLNPDKGGTKYSSNAELVEWSKWLKSLRP